MKKSLLLISLFSSLIFFAGCASDQQVKSLQQKNALLQQQINQEQVQTNTTTTNDTYVPTTTNDTYVPTTTTNDSYTPTSTPAPSYDIPSSSCCKICSKGKACGDSCISRSYTCHKGPGCACDG